MLLLICSWWANFVQKWKLLFLQGWRKCGVNIKFTQILFHFCSQKWIWYLDSNLPPFCSLCKNQTAKNECSLRSLIFSGIAKLLCKCMVTRAVNLCKIWSKNYLYDHFNQRLHIHQTCYFTQVFIFHCPVSITIAVFSKFIILYATAGYFG